MLPKFGIVVKYYEKFDKFKDDFLVRVFLPGDLKDAPSTVMPFSRGTAAAPSFEIEEDQAKVFNITYPLIFAPLVIKQEGFIKVRAVCGSTTTNLGSLMIRNARPEENILLGFPPPLPTLPESPPTSV